ncbi:MAG: putative RNA methyltransferase [Propionibacteriaceae bacterium]
MAIADVVDLLTCPHCAERFALAADLRSVRCANGHAFDLARQGYLNLQGPEPKNADTAAMVAARDRFLGGGHYGLIADRLSGLVLAVQPESAGLLEVGAGTGYYLAGVLSGLSDARGVALDVSVAAARRAAKAHPRIGSVVADAWQRMPLVEGQLDVILDVFAPRNGAEFRRLLRADGVLLTVTPQPEHLLEVREPLGLLDIQPGKQGQLAASLGEHFDQVEHETVEYRVSLGPDALHDLVAM